MVVQAGVGADAALQVKLSSGESTSSKGDGTFQAKQSFGTGGSPYSVAVGDLNGDGKSDLVTENGVLLGNGDGTFQVKQTFDTGNGPESVAVADFNGDGKNDLVTATRQQHRERSAWQRQRNVSGQAVLWHRRQPLLSCCGRLQRRRQE